MTMPTQNFGEQDPSHAQAVDVYRQADEVARLPGTRQDHDGNLTWAPPGVDVEAPPLVARHFPAADDSSVIANSFDATLKLDGSTGQPPPGGVIAIVRFSREEIGSEGERGVATHVSYHVDRIGDLALRLRRHVVTRMPGDPGDGTRAQLERARRGEISMGDAIAAIISLARRAQQDMEEAAAMSEKLGTSIVDPEESREVSDTLARIVREHQV